MATFEFKAEYKYFESGETLPESYRMLLKKAREGLEKAYAPYSEFRVGCAVLLENGQVLSGANIENASFPAGICAERTTLATAQSMFPGMAIRQLAITVESGKKEINHPAAPCGVCRQFMLEKEIQQQNPIEIILQGSKGPVWVIKGVADLLPLYFDRSFLDDQKEPK